MEYLYCKNDNFQDFASGRVLYGGKGIPNFPIRLLLEIYSRALSYLNKEEDLVIYDPCCGGGMPLQFLDITRIDISVRYMVVILMKIWWLMPKKTHHYLPVQL